MTERSALGSPRLAADAAGRLYAVWRADVGIEGGFRMYLAMSDDGLTFSSPEGIGGTWAEVDLAVDATGRIFRLSQGYSTASGYATDFGIEISRSVDGGQTFSGATLFEGTNERPRLGVDDEGHVTVVWSSCPDQACAYYVSRSDDGGDTFSDAVELGRSQPDYPKPLQPLAVGGTPAGPVVVLSGQSASLLHDLFLENLDSPGRVRLSDYSSVTPAEVGAEVARPDLVVCSDGEGSEGRVLVAWGQHADWLPSDHAGIFFSQSKDGGCTFSAPRKVADDVPRADQLCPRNEAVWGSAEVSLAAVDSGTIGIAWVDQHADRPPVRPCGPRFHDVFFTQSTDGGSTFSGPANVSEAGEGVDMPDLAYADSVPVVAWRQYREPGEGFSIRVARAAGEGAFTPTHDTFDLTPPRCGWTLFPTLIAGSPDDVLLAYFCVEEYPAVQRGVATAYSTDSARTFAPARFLHTTALEDGELHSVSVAGSVETGVHVAWKNTELGLFIGDVAWGMFEPWSPVAMLETPEPTAGLSLAVSSRHERHLVWTDGEQGQPKRLEYGDLTQTSFVEQDTLDESALDGPAARVAADRAGRRFVVWLDDAEAPGVVVVRFRRYPAAGP